jgi:hypothetical protein
MVQAEIHEASKGMTKKEVVSQNIGLTFDFIKEIVRKPEILSSVSPGSAIEFVQKDVSIHEHGNNGNRRKFVRVKRLFDVT